MGKGRGAVSSGLIMTAGRQTETAIMTRKGLKAIITVPRRVPLAVCRQPSQDGGRGPRRTAACIRTAKAIAAGTAVANVSRCATTRLSVAGPERVTLFKLLPVT